MAVVGMSGLGGPPSDLIYEICSGNINLERQTGTVILKFLSKKGKGNEFATFNISLTCTVIDRYASSRKQRAVSPTARVSYLLSGGNHAEFDHSIFQLLLTKDGH